MRREKKKNVSAKEKYPLEPWKKRTYQHGIRNQKEVAKTSRANNSESMQTAMHHARSTCPNHHLGRDVYPRHIKKDLNELRRPHAG